MNRQASSAALLLFFFLIVTVGASVPQQHCEAEVKALLDQPRVRQALEYPDSHQDEILNEWIRLTEINAPSGQEKQRAEAVRAMLTGLGLDRVYSDSAGNLIALRKGSGSRKAVVFDAHLDTVFQPGLNIKAVVRDGRIYAPGVGDDTRNVEAMIASIRALAGAGIRTQADLYFVFTVQEETSMGGARHFIEENRNRIGQYVALDGGFEGLTYGGIGINWYRCHFTGPGGHTRSSSPPYSATLPLGRAISRIYSLHLPEAPPVNLNIGMLGGSDVINAKAADAWFSVDLRSTDQNLIQDFEKQITAIVREEAERAGMKWKIETVSKLDAAQLPGNIDSFTVRMARAVHTALGFSEVPLSPAGSNDSNVALLAGIPSISTGTAPCEATHSTAEFCEIAPFYPGIKKLVLMEISLAGLDTREQQADH